MPIQHVKERDKLKPRREPYWHLIAAGQHIGFRCTDDGGHWIARAYDPATRTRQYKTLGDLRTLPDNKRFDEAVKAAREWFEHMGRGGNTETITVQQACARYVENTRRRKGEQAASDAAGRFRRFLAGDPLASITLTKLRPSHVEQWRTRLTETPAVQAKRGPKCKTTTPQVPRARSASSINRDMVALRAALNLAHRDGYVTSDAAWLRKLAPIENADGRRNVYIDRDQRRAMIASLPDDLAAFVRGLATLPLRPGALAALRVKDFDARAGVLTVHTDKAGGGRPILLPEGAVTLLREQARGKLPAAPLFSRWDGAAWTVDRWKKPIAAAARAANMPDGVTAYTFRHSTITDLVTGGLDLFTVGALSGTSIAMIEKHYGHIQRERARDALAGLAL